MEIYQNPEEILAAASHVNVGAIWRVDSSESGVGSRPICLRAVLTNL